MDHTAAFLLIKSPGGTIRARVDNFLHLRVTRQVNAPGEIEFSLPGDHPALDVLETRSIVEVWRRDLRLGLDWTCEARGLYLDQERSALQDDRAGEVEVFTARCPGPLWLLAARIVAYPPRLAGRSLFDGPAASIARALVSYNAGAEAVKENSRIRPGRTDGLFVADGDDEGPELVWECSGANLLTTLQALAAAAGSDFEIEYQPPAAWWFHWCAGISGEDRSASVRFSPQTGTMTRPDARLDQRTSTSAVIAAGVDDQDTPFYAVVERPAERDDGSVYPESRSTESYGYAPACRTLPELEARAAALLSARAPHLRLSFDVVQSRGCAYGVHYRLGDLVSARFQGRSLVFQVRQVEIELSTGGGESVRVECREYGS